MITSQLFKEKLRVWDADLRKKKKIMLLLVNCLAHSTAECIRSANTESYQSLKSALQEAVKVEKD